MRRVCGGARGTNLLDSGAPFYDVYRCADGEYVSIAAIEKKFRAVLIERLRAPPARSGRPISTIAHAGPSCVHA
jgi:crotonobetainyl-CoA:carnitine CoA-transferase CaiB-like acyl-CoA transferase